MYGREREILIQINLKKEEIFKTLAIKGEENYIRNVLRGGILKIPERKKSLGLVY